MTTYDFTIIIIAMLVLSIAASLFTHAVSSKHYYMAIILACAIGGAAFVLFTHL